MFLQNYSKQDLLGTKVKNKTTRTKRQAIMNGQANRLSRLQMIHFIYLAMMTAIVIILMVIMLK